jgi:2-oxo-4-hydroxy-4-carboxy-5-ureidoimidazoline decarboxylase
VTRFRSCTPSRLSREEFVERFGGVYEHSPWVAERVWDSGLDATADEIEALHQQMAGTFLEASSDEQLAVIRAHPDLAGRAAVRGELTEASSAEQAGAGLDQCSAEEFERFTRLNEAYQAKFGFPFIMAVKGSNRHQILEAFEERIDNSHSEEFARALAEINRIALFRLQQL